MNQGALKSNIEVGITQSGKRTIDSAAVMRTVVHEAGGHGSGAADDKVQGSLMRSKDKFSTDKDPHMKVSPNTMSEIAAGRFSNPYKRTPESSKGASQMLRVEKKSSQFLRNRNKESIKKIIKKKKDDD